MSLLHTPIYERGYNEEDDRQELKKLLWSQFMCKCGKCSVKTGKNFMERLPVFILDEIALEERMRFDIDLGYYASPGQPLTTLISKTDVWIQADMKENNLSLMNVGDPVKYTFDIAPGDIFEGTIRSLGYGVATEHYPQNPNGSPGGVTGLCNTDGRVTIMMPHPERTLRTVNFSWAPREWGAQSPWQRMFLNARKWVD